MDREAYDRYLKLEQEHFWRNAKRKLVLQWIEEALPNTTGRVLDIGGAASLITRELKRFGDVTVVEPDAGMLSTIREATVINAIKGGFPDLPVSGLFDLITLLDVLEHIEDDRVALIEIRRFLRDGGVFLVTVPAYMWLWSDHDVALHHKRRYTKHQLRVLLEEAGFEVLRISYWTSVVFPIMLLQRLLDGLRGRALNRSKRQATYRNKTPPVLINRILGIMMDLERVILRKMTLPVGGSIIAVCR